jgi:hypothetical protein
MCQMQKKEEKKKKKKEKKTNKAYSISCVVANVHSQCDAIDDE